MQGIRQVYVLLWGFSVLGQPFWVVTENGYEKKYYPPIEGVVSLPSQIVAKYEFRSAAGTEHFKISFKFSLHLFTNPLFYIDINKNDFHCQTTFILIVWKLLQKFPMHFSLIILLNDFAKKEL